MANYLVNGSDLTSVASAIRTKGGTSAQLAFPADFVTAINAISGGGGDIGTLDGDYITLDFAIVTAGTNTVTNASQIIPYLLGLAGFETSGYSYSWFSVVDHAGSWVNNEIACNDITQRLDTARKMYRYKNGAFSTVTDSSQYDAKLVAGNKFLVSCLRWKGAPTV